MPATNAARPRGGGESAAPAHERDASAARDRRARRRCGLAPGSPSSRGRSRAARRPPPPPPPSRYPALTVIRPIRGLDVGADDNVRALLDSDSDTRVDRDLLRAMRAVMRMALSGLARFELPRVDLRE